MFFFDICTPKNHPNGFNLRNRAKGQYPPGYPPQQPQGYAPPQQPYQPPQQMPYQEPPRQKKDRGCLGAW
ncbi:hypothetical protein KXW58_003927 [Aspergillus fumigatus]|nr:hypothetical protein KXW58_003927 [Aspergillus fumigatus]